MKQAHHSTLELKPYHRQYFSPTTLQTSPNATESSIGVTIQATTDNADETKPQLNEYDALNRQVKVKIGDVIYKYGYNEDGLRIWKEVNGERTYFVWDNDQIVLQLNESGAVNKKHVRALTLIYSEDDDTTTKDKVFYNYNAHGDVVQLLDAEGNVTKYYQYDSFGNEINEDENDENPWRYCGEYYDKETKTIYLRARYYNPGYGRFTTRDTYTGEQNDPLSLNLYTYCGNEPVLHVDPSGHKMILSGNKQAIKKYLRILTGAKKIITKTQKTSRREKNIGINSSKITYVKKLVGVKKKKYPHSVALVNSIIRDTDICTVDCSSQYSGATFGIYNNKIVTISIQEPGTTVPVPVEVDGRYAMRAMPNYLALAHELIHCYHFFSGTYYMQEVPYQSDGLFYHYILSKDDTRYYYPIHRNKYDSEKQVYKAIEAFEEARTVGLDIQGWNEHEEYTENMIRHEHQLNRRCCYYDNI